MTPNKSKLEVSECCGAEIVELTIEKGLYTIGCSKCGKPFIPNTNTEQKATCPHGAENYDCEICHTNTECKHRFIENNMIPDTCRDCRKVLLDGTNETVSPPPVDKDWQVGEEEAFYKKFQRYGLDHPDGKWIKNEYGEVVDYLIERIRIAREEAHKDGMELRMDYTEFNEKMAKDNYESGRQQEQKELIEKIKEYKPHLGKCGLINRKTLLEFLLSMK